MFRLDYDSFLNVFKDRKLYTIQNFKRKFYHINLFIQYNIYTV